MMVAATLKRRGITLLELILAIAILGGSMGVLAQIAGTGTDAAREASDLAVARLLGQRKMSEILLDSFSTPTSISESPIEPFDSTSLTSFVYSVEVQPGQLDGLLSVRVTVKSQNTNGGFPTAIYTLDRWLIDPMMGLVEAEAEELAVREEAASAGGAAPL